MANLDADNRPEIVAAVDAEWEGGPENLDKVFIWYNSQAGYSTDFPIDLNLPASLWSQAPNDVAVGQFVATPESPFADIVSANAGDDSLTTLNNLGFQNFALNTTAGCSGDLRWSFYAITSDVFGPGPHHDIAAVQIESDYVMVQHGNGLGGFTQDCNQYGPDIYHLSPPGGAPLRAFRPRDITSGHLNGGVKPDLVATLNAYGGIQDPHPDYVAILMGKGDGTFQHSAASTQYYRAVPAGSTPVKVIIADLTRDGFGDIITSNHESNSISVLVNMMLVISP